MAPSGALVESWTASAPGGRRGKLLAADYLRHPLVADLEERCDVCHRQSVAVRLADRVVTLLPEFLGLPAQRELSPGVAGCELREPGVCFGCFALRTRNPGIVEGIPTNELARTVRNATKLTSPSRGAGNP